MAKRKQIKISLSNSVLKGNENRGIQSEFKALGENGLAIYFLLLQRMGGQGITWICINSIMNQLNLQRRNKNQIIESINFLVDKKLIIGEKINKDTKNGDELEFEIETDLEDLTYTIFYPNNFTFCKMLGTKGFSLFCMIDSFVGTNKNAYCSISTLQSLTGFSNSTIVEYIYIMEKLNMYVIEHGAYNPIIKRNTNNTYTINSKGRIDLLERDIEEVKIEVSNIIAQLQNIK